MADFARARRNMVDCQIRTNRVTDPRIIAAFDSLPRERFIDQSLVTVAYVDQDLAVAPDRFLMEPRVMARMLEALAIGPDEVVLDVGCGTGDSSALMAQLAATVVALESDPDLAAQATANLTGLAVDNAVVVEGPLNRGYAAQAPYDVIFLGGAVPEITPVITDQLAEGGRACAVISTSAGGGTTTLFLRRRGAVSAQPLFDAATAPLPGLECKPGFVF